MIMDIKDLELIINVRNYLQAEYKLSLIAVGKPNVELSSRIFKLNRLIIKYEHLLKVPEEPKLKLQRGFSPCSL